VPKKVIIVKELPRNPSGKIIKKKLRDMYSQEGSEVL
jgi:acyl-coenzyme A synthetase/AMP-(fatty) acid ligase